MTANYHTPIITGESNSPATINTRLSGLDSGIGSVADAVEDLIIDAGTSDAETIAARTSIRYKAGSPPSSLSVALSYAATGVYNVKAYGAIGNGVADDTTAIQDAINACSSDGGGVVFLPMGTYKITVALTMASYVILRGVGPKSIIDWRSTTNANAVNFGNATDAAIETLQIQNLSTVCASSAILTGSSSARIRVRAVKIIGTTITKAISSISGNGTTVTVTASAHGFATSDNVHVYDTVSAYDAPYANITVTGANTFTDLSSTNIGTISTGIVAKSMWLNGVRLEGTDSIVEGCYISTGVHCGMRAYGTALRNKYLHNYVTDVDRGIMVDFEGGAGASYNLIAHNTFHLCKAAASKIEATAVHNTFSNNMISECSKRVAVNGTLTLRGAYTLAENNQFFFVDTVGLAAIDVDSSASHIVIKGNAIEGHPGYGIYLQDNVTFCDILGNHLTGCGTGIRATEGGIAYLMICNNRITTSSAWGIRLASLTDFVIQNNMIVDVTTASGIYLESSCLRGSIVGNLIAQIGTYGIGVLGSATPSKYISIVGNSLHDVGNSVSNAHISLAANQELISIVGNVMTDTPNADSVQMGTAVQNIVVGNATSAGINVSGVVIAANNY